MSEHPTSVHADVVTRFLREVGFNPHDVCEVVLRPTYAEVDVYERVPATGKIALIGKEPATRTVVLAVTR